MFGNPRSLLVLQAALAIATVAVGYCSVMMLIGTVERIPLVGRPLLWTLLTLWVLGFLALVVRPFNTRAMNLLGARPPWSGERPILDRAWHEVLDRAGVSAARYTLLVVDADDRNEWFHRDLGMHVVTIAEDVIDDVDEDALAALLAQRLARQTSHLALLVGMCIWAALPLAMILTLGVLAFRTIRRTGRAFTAAAGNAKPRTESQAGVGLFFYLIGFACLVLLLIVVISLAVVALFAVVVALVSAWLARRAELAADTVAVGWGYGPALRHGLARLDELDRSLPPRTATDRVAGLFSTYLPAARHLAHLRRVQLR